MSLRFDLAATTTDRSNQSKFIVIKEEDMPIYEYYCSDCKTRFETLRSMREADAPIACAHCHGERTSRVLSVFAAQSGGQAIAGTNGGGCAGCSSGSCAGCGHH